MLSELLRWVVKERSPAAQLAAVRQRLDRKWDIALSDMDFGSTANYLNDVLGRVLDLQTGRETRIKGGFTYNSLAWWPDSESVVYLETVSGRYGG